MRIREPGTSENIGSKKRDARVSEKDTVSGATASSQPAAKTVRIQQNRKRTTGKFS